MSKKVSIKDIAKKVGVSTASVSYVLNGLEKEKRVGRAVVEKIHKAVKELNYKPNQIARSLRSGITKTIGLIVADISNPFFSHLSRKIEDEAAAYGYTVIFGSSDENHKKSTALVEILLNRQVDGLIIIPSEGSLEHIKSLVQNKTPLVLVDRYFPEIPTNYVVLDNYKATYSAVKCLVSQGRKKIILVAYKSALAHMQERIRGYREAMKDSGLSEEITIKKMHYSFLKGDMEKVINELISEKKANAVIFATNAISIAGLYAIRHLNLKVPEELAVIGFDGHEVFDFFHPQLTYIQQPLEEMGKVSTKILIDQISGSKEIVHVKLQHQLIKRESC